MASNFRITVHENSDSLHLKLVGEFDGDSAWELLNVLKKRAGRVCRVFVHTSSLKRVHPFGRETFREHLGDLDAAPPWRILFTGDHACQLAPERRLCH